MGRASLVFGFWLIGYALGFFGYLLYPAISAALLALLPSIFITPEIVGAFLSGIAGSIISTVVVVV